VTISEALLERETIDREELEALLVGEAEQQVLEDARVVPLAAAERVRACASPDRALEGSQAGRR